MKFDEVKHLLLHPSSLVWNQVCMKPWLAQFVFVIGALQLQGANAQPWCYYTVVLLLTLLMMYLVGYKRQRMHMLAGLKIRFSLDRVFKT